MTGSSAKFSQAQTTPWLSLGSREEGFNSVLAMFVERRQGGNVRPSASMSVLLGNAPGVRCVLAAAGHGSHSGNLKEGAITVAGQRS